MQTALLDGPIQWTGSYLLDNGDGLATHRCVITLLASAFRWGSLSLCMPASPHVALSALHASDVEHECVFACTASLDPEHAAAAGDNSDEATARDAKRKSNASAAVGGEGAAGGSASLAAADSDAPPAVPHNEAVSGSPTLDLHRRGVVRLGKLTVAAAGDTEFGPFVSHGVASSATPSPRCASHRPSTHDLASHIAIAGWLLCHVLHTRAVDYSNPPPLRILHLHSALHSAVLAGRRVGCSR